MSGLCFRSVSEGRAWRMVFGGCLLLVGIANAAAADPLYYFTTYAGTPSMGADDGPAADARLNFPERLALDAAGNIFVADSGNRLVRKISPTGLVTTIAGLAEVNSRIDGPAGTASFGNVSDIALDSSGAIFVADNVALRRIAPDGAVSTFAGYAGLGYPPPFSIDGVGTSARFNGLGSLAIGPDGTIYAGDGGPCTVRQITTSAVVTTLAGMGVPGAADGTGSAAGFYGPGGLAVGPDGVIYAADTGNDTIRRIQPSGAVTTVAGRAGDAGFVDGPATDARFNHPADLAVDAAGTIFVADNYNQSIRVISPTGQVRTLAGHAGTTADAVADGTGSAGTFGTPNGIALDAAGNAYVADSVSNTIRKVTPAGVVTTVAGLAPNHSAGAVDGDRQVARFFQPQGIAVAADGTCYIADTSNQVIRKISPTGIVTTLAGLAGQSGYANGTGGEARFNLPTDLAVDGGGNVYVIDSNCAVRKITPAGVVTTLAGPGSGPGVPTDGTGDAAVFYTLSAIAADANGNVWVAEFGGSAPDKSATWPAQVRRITPAGVVTTVTALAGGNNTVYRGLAVDASGVVYACDPNNERLVRMRVSGIDYLRFNGSGYDAFAPGRVAVAPTGRVFLSDLRNGGCRVALLGSNDQLQIIGGGINRAIHKDGIGTEALFQGLAAIGADASGALYVACTDNTIRKGTPAAAPAIVVQPSDQAVAAGASVLFSVQASGVPDPTYQWYLNGAPIPQATGASYGLKAAGAADAGDYSVTVTNSLGSVTSNKAALKITASTPPPPGGDAGAGGGGGAVSGWFLGALAVLGGLKAKAVRRRAALGQQL